VVASTALGAGLWRGAQGAAALDSEIGDPVLTAVIAAGALEDAEARGSVLQELAWGLSADEGYRLLSLMASASSPSSSSDEFVRLLLRRLAEADVAALEHWARDLPEGTMRAAAFTALALQRSEVDGLGAVEWARHLGSSASEAAALVQVATELARLAPVDALDLAGRLPASPLRDQCLAHGVAQWAATEPVAAAAWAAGVDDNALRARLLARVVTAMAATDPEAAADWTAGALPQGPVQVGTAVAVAQRWAQLDPEAARSWTGTFPDDRLRKAALAAVEQATRGQPRHEAPAGE